MQEIREGNGPKASISVTQAQGSPESDLTLDCFCRPSPTPRAGTDHQVSALPLYLKETKANLNIAEKQRKLLCQRQLDTDTFAGSTGLREDDPAMRSNGATPLLSFTSKRCVINGRTSANHLEGELHGTAASASHGRNRSPQMTIKKALTKYDRKQCSYKELYYLLKEMCQHWSRCSFPTDELPVPTLQQQRQRCVTRCRADDGRSLIGLQAMPSAQSLGTFGMMATYGLRDPRN